MNLPERKEQQSFPENSNLIAIDPEELIKDNPAGLIINPTTYNTLKVAFDPVLFDIPQVVRVRTYSPQHGEITKLFVVDGLNRTKYVADHKEELEKKHPNWRFYVKDVTDSYLHHPDVVRQEDLTIQQNQIGSTALTTIQYLRAVIPWTKAHGAIAPDRIAAHLINGWESMIGDQTAKRFSALAALSFLASPAVSQATDEMLGKYLGRQDRITGEEKTINQRRAMENKLREMASIIRESDLRASQVAKSAFKLVAERSSIIGGDEKAQEQVYGLLYSPAVENKLEAVFPERGPREQARDQLREFIIETMQQLSVVYKRDSEQIMPAIEEPLKDSVINFNRVVEIFQSGDPRRRYREIKQEINYERIKQAFVKVQRKEELSDIAQVLIESNSRTTYLEEGEVHKIVSAVRVAEQVSGEVKKWSEDYTQRQDELSQAGVDLHVVANELTKIAQAQAELLSLQQPSPQQINNRTGAIREQLVHLNKKINVQVAKHKVGEIVDKVFADQLQTVHGPILREALIGYTFSSIVAQSGGEIQITGFLIPKIKAVFREMQDLDPDLFADVLYRGRKLRSATEIQNQRKARTVTSTPLSTLPKQEETVEAIRPEPQKPIEELIPEERKKLSEEIDIERIVAERKAIEEKRRRIMNERFVQRAVSFLDGLTEIDLDSEEYFEDSRQLGLSIVRKLALSIERIEDPIENLRNLREENRRLQDVNTRLREQLVHKQEEDAQKDTRTGR